MPDLAVCFDARKPFDGSEVANRFQSVLAMKGIAYTTVRITEPHIAAVNLLKSFSYGGEQPVRGDESWLLFDGAFFEPPGGADPSLRESRVLHRLLEIVTSEDRDRLLGLNGQFNALLYRPMEKRLTLITDRLGSRPLYHVSKDGRHLIASEMKALLAGAGESFGLDPLGLLEFFAFGHNIGRRTVLDGVTVLPPGSVITIDGDGLRSETYFRYRYRAGSERASPAEWGEAFAKCVKEAIPRVLEGPGRKGIFLSGGLDSRVVAGALGRREESLAAFTFGYPESRDVKYAAETARILNFRHRVLTYPRVYLSKVLGRVVERTECAVPFHHATSVLFHERIAEGADLIFVGFCGDVFSGGHLSPGLFQAAPGPELNRLLLERAACCQHGDLSGIFRADVFPALMRRLEEAFEASVESIREQSAPDTADVWDVENRQRRFTFSAPKVDRYRFEVLAPFLDNRIVDLVLTLPQSARRNQIAYRHAILQGFPGLRSVPWAATGRPVEVNPLRHAWQEAFRLGLRAASAALCRMGLKIGGLGWQYRDLDEEIRRDTDLFDEHLTPFLQGGRFPGDLLSREGIENRVRRHREGRSNAAHLVSALLTLGTFLDLCDDWRQIPPT